MSHSHEKAIQKKGGYVDDKGIRHLSPKEQKEKTKNWPKSDGKGSVAWPKTDGQKRQHQHRFGRAWND